MQDPITACRQCLGLIDRLNSFLLLLILAPWAQQIIQSHPLPIWPSWGHWLVWVKGTQTSRHMIRKTLSSSHSKPCLFSVDYRQSFTQSLGKMASGSKSKGTSTPEKCIYASISSPWVKEEMLSSKPNASQDSFSHYSLSKRQKGKYLQSITKDWFWLIWCFRIS